MKRLILFIFIPISLGVFQSTAQSLITKSDSIPLSQDSKVKLVVPEYRGTIQWQKSIDGENWMDISGESSDSLKITSTDEQLYRAMVSDGTCIPFFSDSALIVSNDSISTNYLIPSNSSFLLVSDSLDINEGIYKYINGIDVSDFEIGKVIVDSTTRAIRKISEIIYQEDTVINLTEQATLEDIFQDIQFKLSSSMIQPQMDLKSATPGQISQALTDENGFIHPVSIMVYDESGVKLKSTSVFDAENTQNELYWHLDIDAVLWDIKAEGILPDKDGNFIKLSGNTKCYFSDSYITLDPEFKFEFDFKRPKINWDEMKISRGELKTFKYYSDESIIDVKVVLAQESDVSFTVGKKISILPKKLKVSMNYLIGVIPLWVDYEMDLMVEVSASIGAGLNEYKGFQNKTYLTFGVGYENKDWYLINDCFNNYTPISYGIVNSSTELRADIYPSIVWKFYSLAGPFVEAGPYLNFQSVNSENNNWDKHLGLGFDGRVGILAGFLNYDFFSCSFSKNLFNKTIWDSPANLELVSGNSQSAEVGTQLANPVKVKVLTSRNTPVEGAQVYFRPLHGSVDKGIVVTDPEGYAQSNWIMSESDGINRMEVFLKNGRDEELHDLKLDITATATAAPVITAPAVTTLSKTEVTETSARLNGEVTSDGGSSITQRGFYWSQTNTNPGPTTGGTQVIVSGTTGSFYYDISGLQANTTYYYAAFAANAQRTSTGSVLNFKTNETQGSIGPRDTQTAVVDVTNPATGKTWMDRNLGASRAATSSTDAEAYGDLYQWGRAADGHQKRTSGTTTSLSSSDTPGHSNFIVVSSSPYDWRSPQNDNLWQGVNGINNPCPVGYQLPTEAELNAERLSWSSNNGTGAFASPLKLPVAGYRDGSDGSLYGVGSGGHYWSCTVGGSYSRLLYFYSSDAGMSGSNRSYGFSARCLKDSEPQAGYTLNLTVNPEGAGTFTGAGQYSAGQQVSIGATASTGWEFSGWTGDTGHVNDPAAANTTLTMPTYDITLTASFRKEEPRIWPRDTQTAVVDVTNPATGKTWMDRNLGASRAASSSTDAEAYGDLYQWGRAADGHQKRTSDTTPVLSSSDTPGHGSFIVAPNSPYDWRSPQNDNLWQGVNGTNNPCPDEYRLPTEAELNAERLSWSSNDDAGAFASPLKLPLPGYRYSNGGSLNEVGYHGYYWSGTVDGTSAWGLVFLSSNASLRSYRRAYVNSVRCIKD